MSDYKIPGDCRYTEEDEWLRMEDGHMVVGITDYAQQQLGDIVFIELPSAGDTVDRGEPFGVIESVKAVSDLYAPISGKVSEANADLVEQPELINEHCYSDGWLIAVSPSDEGELEALMDPSEYQRYLSNRKE